MLQGRADQRGLVADDAAPAEFHAALGECRDDVRKVAVPAIAGKNFIADDDEPDLHAASLTQRRSRLAHAAHRPDFGGGLLRTGPRLRDGDPLGQHHTHASPVERLRLAEQPDVDPPHPQRLIHALARDRRFLEAAVNDGARAGRTHRGRHRQAQNSARMQLEFVELLACHGDNAGVMRSRAHFAEPHSRTLYELLDTEDAAAAEAGGDLGGDGARLGERGRVHILRLPALDIVAFDLDVADWLAEKRLDFAAVADRAHGEQGDLVIELDHFFDDHPPQGDAAALAKARTIATKVTTRLGGRGIFGGELFVKGARVWFSELSPRPHDTAMVTMPV